MNSNTPRLRMAKLYQDGSRQTQDSTCGPASVILACLSLGLEKKEESDWRKPELKTWMPVDDFLQRGMAIHELQFVSEMIFPKRLEVQFRRAYPENYPQFLSDLKSCFQQTKQVIICNFLQKDFVKNLTDPSGDPHYSPLLDFDEGQQKIQVADVDPLVHEPYWTDIKLMFQSMSIANPAFNLPRGWLILTRRA